jgi:beta-mannosidase
MVGWYNQLFNERIPKVLSEIDPDKFYWPTSPSTSSAYYEAEEFKSGDIHYYGVWGACSDIEEYKNYIGRFNSEYGMQGMIDLSSMRKFSSEDSWDINSDTMKIHERHISGWKNINYYLENYFKTPKNFESCI